MPIELSVLTEKLREQGKTEDEIQSITKYYDDYVQQEDLQAKQLEQQQADEEAANRSVVGSAASKLARGWVSAAKGATALKNNIIFGAINAFNPDLNVEEKKGISNALKNVGGITFDPKYGMGGTVAGFDKVIEELDQNVRLTEFSTVSESVEKGNYLEAIELAVGGILETTPSIAAAYGGYGAIALFGASVAGNKFDEEFEANPEQSIQNLTLNALGTGALESTFELATRGLMKYTGLIANKSGSETAKEFLKTGFTSVAKKMGVAGIGEGIGETATELSVMGLDAITLGKDIDLFAKETLYRLGDSFILGNLMGNTMGAVGSVNSAARNRAEFLLTPIDTKKQMLSVASEISRLTKDLSNTQTEEGKKIISDKINKLENNLVRARAEVSKGLNSLNQEELSAYAKNQDEIIKLQQILSSNDPDLTKQTAVEKIVDLQNQNYDLFVSGAKRHLAKNIETIKPAAEKLGVEIQEFNTAEDFAKATGQSGDIDGFIQGNNIFINNQVASQKDAISVGSHELLHRIIGDKLTDRDTRLELANGLIEILREEGNLDVVQKRIDDSYKFKLDKDGNVVGENKFEDYAEEYFTVFSDAIVKGDIQYKETVFQKILNFFNSFVNKFTPFKQAKFNTAQQAYDFVKDYSKNIQKGVVTEQAIDLAGQATTEVKGSVTQADRTALGNQIKALVPKGTTKQQYDSEVIGDVYNDLVIGDRLNGIIRGQLNKFGVTGDNVFGKSISNFVEDVKQQLFERSLTRFNPETNDDLGGFVVSELQQFRIGDVVNRYRREQAGSLDVQAGETGSIRTPVADEAVDVETTEAPRSELKQGLKVGGEQFVDQKLEDEIEANTIEIVEGVTPETNDKDFKTFVKDAAQQKSFKSVKGKLKNFEKFLEDNHSVLFNSNNLPIATLVAMERRTPAADRIFTGEPTRLTTQAQIDKAIDEGDFYVENEKQGPSKYPRKKPTVEQVKKHFGLDKGSTVGASTKGTRKDGLVNAISFSLFRDIVPGVMNRADIVQEDIAKVSAKLVVDPTIKFSKSIDPFKNLLDWNIIIDRVLEGTGTKRIEMTTEEGRKRFLDYAEKSGLISELPESFWRSMQGTSDNLVTKQEDRDLIKKLQKEGFGVYSEQPLRGFKGNLPFRNVVEAQTWINGVKKRGGKFAPESEMFSDMLKKENPRAKKLPLEKALNDKEFLKRQDNSIKGLKKVFQIFEKYMEKSEGVAFVGALLSSSGASQNHFIRKAAPYRFYEKGYLNNAYKQEHTLPASLVGKYLFQQALDKNINKSFENVERNYFQGALLEVSDNKLKGTNYDYVESTPEGWSIDGNIWDRYFNLNVGSNKGGINTSNIILAGNKSIVDVLGIDSFGRATNKSIQTSKQETFNKSTDNKYSKSTNNDGLLNDLNNHDKALRNARDLNAPKKGISIFDFDDTLATSKSKVIVTVDGKTKKITPAEFAKQHSKLEEQGAEFDFSEFNKVVDGKPGPLAAKLKKAIDKFGNKDVFVLTARPQASAQAIYDFLKGIGLEVPLQNITGLEDGTPQAKANWVIGKAGEGYNDFYFTDDVYKNVKAVQEALEVVDVKSKTRLAYSDRVKKLDRDFNDIIEAKTGIAAEKEYGKTKAEVVGANKGKFTFFIPPSAEDFVGLLYNTLSKGKLGDSQMAWYKKNLLDPYASAMSAISRERISLMEDYKTLKKQLGVVPKDLNKKIPGDIYTNEQAVRVYIWNKQGMTIPGLSKADLKELTDYIEGKPELKVFGDQLIAINKDDGYAAPTSGWLAGTTTTDIMRGLGTTKRAKHLQQWQQNVDIIFSEKNLNKLEAANGKPYRVALEGILQRMKTGRNRSFTGDSMTGKVTDWLTNSIGTIMFFNTRSALLQTISAVNFVNFTDNNIFKAGKAYANQKQFWKDFMSLMNSEFLVDRRRGLRINVNEADIANMANESGARGVVAKMLEIGFLPTQIADSFAIASGGATFYRNRINTYKKQGLSDQQAQEKAFNDFREIAEESQQSSRPDRISQQQAGPLGRIILAFANTPMQYARLIKKAVSDLKNRRGDVKTNISKIIYYGFVQNLIFNALQQAIFAIGFGNVEEEEDEKEKYLNTANGMVDSLLRGIGIAGAFTSVGKNIIVRVIKESQKKNPKYEKISFDLARISPPISSKLSRLNQAGRAFQWQKEEMREKGFAIDNPALMAGANVISAATNVPIDRLVRKANNVNTAVSQDLELWERFALLGGWQAWELGIDDEPKKPKAKAKFGETIQTRKRVVRKRIN